MTGAHSIFGASGAHRWIACPGSVQAQAGLPNDDNEASARGTAAHTLAELCLRYDEEPSRHLGEIISVGERSFVVDETMVDAVQSYVEVVRHYAEGAHSIMVEQPFDLSHIRPGMFGTNDACVLRPDGHLIVIDYKNGYGLVDVVDNPQLKYYALGALHFFASQKLFVDRVTLVIVQPNAPHAEGTTRTWDIDPLDLIDFEIALGAAVDRANKPNAPRIPGDHCEYCLAAATCEALTTRINAFAASEFDPVAEISMEKLTQLLDAATIIETRIKAAWALALDIALSGGEIPGYKLVERKARRNWRDADTLSESAIAKAIAEATGLDPDDLFKRVLKSPAQAEKLLPAKERKALEPFVEKKSSGLTLTRDVDPRVSLPAYHSALLDFEEVGDKPPLLF